MNAEAAKLGMTKRTSRTRTVCRARTQGLGAGHGGAGGGHHPQQRGYYRYAERRFTYNIKQGNRNALLYRPTVDGLKTDPHRGGGLLPGGLVHAQWRTADLGHHERRQQTGARRPDARALQLGLCQLRTGHAGKQARR